MAPLLLVRGKLNQKDLREELKTILDELTYTKLMEHDATLVDSVNKIQEKNSLIGIRGVMTNVQLKINGPSQQHRPLLCFGEKRNETL